MFKVKCSSTGTKYRSCFKRIRFLSTNKMSSIALNFCEKCARNLLKSFPSHSSKVNYIRAVSSLQQQLNEQNDHCQNRFLRPESFSGLKPQHYMCSSHQLNYIQKRCYKISWFSSETELSKAVSNAEKIVGYPTSFLNLRCLFSDELSTVALQIRKLVGTKHPLLKTARGLVFDGGHHNLQMRGLLVMLVSKAAGPAPRPVDQDTVSGVYLSQRSLAEITEVIHTANLIHKGVLNLSSAKPEDGPIGDLEVGNKMAVLSGDYLLASACTGLAKLENPTVLQKIATSIGDMMTAEFTRFTDADGKPQIPETCQGFSDWLCQTYLSLGSLVARSCQSAMILAGHDAHTQDRAFAFGENITYAQELCADLLPFLRQDEMAGLSLASAPVFLYKESASQEDFSHLTQLVEAGPQAYPQVVSIVKESGVVQKCIDLCLHHRDLAIKALDCFPDSDAKTALINMVQVASECR